MCVCKEPACSAGYDPYTSRRPSLIYSPSLTLSHNPNNPGTVHTTSSLPQARARPGNTSAQSHPASKPAHTVRQPWRLQGEPLQALQGHPASKKALCMQHTDTLTHRHNPTDYTHIAAACSMLAAAVLACVPSNASRNTHTASCSPSRPQTQCFARQHPPTHAPPVTTCFQRLPFSCWPWLLLFRCCCCCCCYYPCPCEGTAV